MASRIRLAIVLRLDRDVPPDVLAKAKAEAIATVEADQLKPEDFILPPSLQALGVQITNVEFTFDVPLPRWPALRPTDETPPVRAGNVSFLPHELDKGRNQ